MRVLVAGIFRGAARGDDPLLTPDAGITEADVDLGRVAADAIGAVVSGTQRADEVTRLLHRAEALRRVASDIGSRLDLDRILTGLVEHAMVLFEADRGAVFMRRPDGAAVAEVSRGLSAVRATLSPAQLGDRDD